MYNKLLFLTLIVSLFGCTQISETVDQAASEEASSLSPLAKRLKADGDYQVYRSSMELLYESLDRKAASFDKKNRSALFSKLKKGAENVSSDHSTMVEAKSLLLEIGLDQRAADGFDVQKFHNSHHSLRANLIEWNITEKDLTAAIHELENRDMIIPGTPTRRDACKADGLALAIGCGIALADKSLLCGPAVFWCALGVAASCTITGFAYVHHCRS